MGPRSVTGPFRLATRGSPLALRQTDLVAQALRSGHRGLNVEVLVVRTQGDDLSAPLDQIGGQGVFVTEVEAAVADGRAEAAVHSAKDMTSVMSSDLVLAAVPPRGDPRDGLVGATLAGLPQVAQFIRLPVTLNPDVSAPFVQIDISQPGAAPSSPLPDPI